MPEETLRVLQRLIRETLAGLPYTEEVIHRRQCLVEADRLVDEIVSDLATGGDRQARNEKVYRLLILAGEGGVYGKPSGP